MCATRDGSALWRCPAHQRRGVRRAIDARTRLHFAVNAAHHESRRWTRSHRERKLLEEVGLCGPFLPRRCGQQQELHAISLIPKQAHTHLRA